MPNGTPPPRGLGAFPLGLGPYDPSDARDLFTCQADFADPFGVLDLADLSGFVESFNSELPRADLAQPAGVYDAADLSAFLSFFNAGCQYPELFDPADLYLAAGETFDPATSVVWLAKETSPDVNPLVLSSSDPVTGEIGVDGSGEFVTDASFRVEGVPENTYFFTDVFEPGTSVTVVTNLFAKAGTITIGQEEWNVTGLSYHVSIEDTSSPETSEYSFELFLPMHAFADPDLARQTALLYADADEVYGDLFLGSGEHSQCVSDYITCLQAARMRHIGRMAACSNDWLGDCIGGGAVGCVGTAFVCNLFGGPGAGALCCAGGAIIGCGVSILYQIQDCIEDSQLAMRTDGNICFLQLQACAQLDCNVGCP